MIADGGGTLTAVIEATGLERRFGDIVAVDGIDLRVDSGEIFGFLGPNGAGKSTVVRILTTLLRPTAGSASVGGFDLATRPGDIRRLIGVALQDAAIDPLMTGRELIRLQAVLHGISRNAVRTRGPELLERVGLTGAADRRVATYSGGMRRRLDLALALVHEPEILFLDEPTTGLDPQSRLAIWDHLNELHDEGTTILLTTQMMDEADQLCQRLAIIDNGLIVAEGAPGALKDDMGDDVVRISLTTAGDGIYEKARSLIGGQGYVTGSSLDEEGLVVHVQDADASAPALLKLLIENDMEVARLAVSRPTPDDVFLKTHRAHHPGRQRRRRRL